jgi:hypothetical protein
MGHCARFASGLLLLLVTVSTARAGDELYLRWDNCIGDGGVYNRTFACDTNLGVETLVGSFRLDQDLAEMSGIQAFLAIGTLDPINLPSWWTFGTGQCRLASSLSASFNPPATSTNCLNGWAGRAVGGLNWGLQYPYSVARISIIAALPAPASFAALAGQEVYAFTVSISHARSVGLGSCAGCGMPACISFGHAGLGGPSFTHPWIVGSTTPNNGSNVTWQTGAVATTSGTCSPYGNCTTSVICQSETPARGHTWGSIKSLYR